MEKPKTSSDKRRKKPVASADGVPEAPISVAPVLLSVHLWTEGGRDAPELALAMVGDFLSTSPCEVREGLSSCIAASFLDTVQAVNAARRLRRLVQGFSQTARAGRMGGCFILSSLEEGDLEVENQLKHRLSVVAPGHSGQVLVVGGLCDSARSIPGLRFEALSEEVLTAENHNLYRPVMLLMPPVQMEGYVKEPAEWWAPSVGHRQQVATADELVNPVSSAEPPLANYIEKMSVPSAVEPVMPGGREITGFSRRQRTAGRTFPIRWVALGCVAVFVMAVIAIRVSGSRRSEHPAAQSQPVARPASNPPAVVPANVAISPVPAPTVTAEEPKPVAKLGKPNAQDIRDAAKAKRKASNAAPGQVANGGDMGAGMKRGGADSTGIIFSADEINLTIALADRESGDGKFDSAIRRYRIVLRHDPSNARAKEGLDRAIRNKGRQK